MALVKIGTVAARLVEKLASERQKSLEAAEARKIVGPCKESRPAVVKVGREIPAMRDSQAVKNFEVECAPFSPQDCRKSLTRSVQSSLASWGDIPCLADPAVPVSLRVIRPAPRLWWTTRRSHPPSQRRQSPRECGSSSPVTECERRSASASPNYGRPQAKPQKQRR